MFASNLKLAAALVLALGVFTAGAGVIMHDMAAARQPDQAPDEPPKKLDPSRVRAEMLKILANGGPNALAPEAPPLADLPAERVKALLGEAAGPMKSLLTEQLEAARTEADSRWKWFLTGQGTLDIFLGSSRRLLQAELDLSRRKDDQIAALEAHRQRMQDVETVNQARFDAARIGIQDLAQSRFYRVRATLWVERVKAGQPLPNPAGGP